MFRKVLLRRARRRDERGQALVETAIVIPVILLLTFGAIELGLGFSQKGTLEAAVRTGARTASARHERDDMPTLVADTVNSGLSGSSLGEVNELWVYKVPATGTLDTCDDTTDCVLFTVRRRRTSSSC